MIVCKIKGRGKLTAREKRYLSEYLKDMFMSYNLEYVFLGVGDNNTTTKQG